MLVIAQTCGNAIQFVVLKQAHREENSNDINTILAFSFNVLPPGDDGCVYAGFVYILSHIILITIDALIIVTHPLAMNT